LRGLAALLRAVSPERLQELTNLDELVVFLADTLDEMAEALDGEGGQGVEPVGDPRRAPDWPSLKVVPVADTTPS
jgi:hypothetical protein